MASAEENFDAEKMRHKVSKMAQDIMFLLNMHVH